MYNRKKINIFEFLPLLLIVWFLSYLTLNVNSEYQELKESVSEWKEVIADNNLKIEEKDIYKRLQDYWYNLKTIDSILNYKDSIVNWYNFLLDLRNNIPKDATINTLSYSIETWVINIQLIAPTEERLIQSMNELEKFNGLYWIQFNTISKEKVSFVWDKTTYEGYSTTIDAYIEKSYLDDKYELIRKYKRIKYDIWDTENVMDITQEYNENTFLSWSTLLEDFNIDEEFSWTGELTSSWTQDINY